MHGRLVTAWLSVFNCCSQSTINIETLNHLIQFFTVIVALVKA